MAAIPIDTSKAANIAAAIVENELVIRVNLGQRVGLSNAGNPKIAENKQNVTFPYEGKKIQFKFNAWENVNNPFASE